MFAKLFIVVLALVCVSAAQEHQRTDRAAVYPLAYSAGVVPVASYSPYSTAYSTYSGSPLAYSAYSAPVAASPYYYGRSVFV